jgi:hypothetical protein
MRAGEYAGGRRIGLERVKCEMQIKINCNSLLSFHFNEAMLVLIWRQLCSGGWRRVVWSIPVCTDVGYVCTLLHVITCKTVFITTAMRTSGHIWYLSEVRNVPSALTKTFLFSCLDRIHRVVNILCYLITWDLRRLEFIVYQCYHQHLPLDQYCLLAVETRRYLMFPIYSTESSSSLQFSPCGTRFWGILCYHSIFCNVT